MAGLGHSDVRPVAPRVGAPPEIGWRMTIRLGAGPLIVPGAIDLARDIAKALAIETGSRSGGCAHPAA